MRSLNTLNRNNILLLAKSKGVSIEEAIEYLKKHPDDKVSITFNKGCFDSFGCVTLDSSFLQYIKDYQFEKMFLYIAKKHFINVYLGVDVVLPPARITRNMIDKVIACIDMEYYRSQDELKNIVIEKIT